MTALQTKIRLPQPPYPLLRHGDSILSIGSCFSEHIGTYLADMGHNICINPFGIQYNPISIVQAISRIIKGEPYIEEEIYEFDGMWHSSLHHGNYSANNPSECLRRINEDLDQARLTLQDCKYLILTWGTAWIYHDRLRANAVVSNCHKRPEKDFLRRLYQVSELVDAVLPTLQHLMKLNPDLQIITTISPIRHLRDGAHGNQLSKATLLLMDETLRETLGERYHYFPSYEILLDELRDYRFYADDMSHPSPLAQRIIREALTEWLIAPESLAIAKEVFRLKSQYEHRPLQPDHPEAELRREQLLLLIYSLQAKYPSICLRSWFNG